MAGRGEVAGLRERAPARATEREVLGAPVSGSPEEIAEAIRAFGVAGYTQVELLLWPPTLAALEAMAPVVELLEGD